MIREDSTVCTWKAKEKRTNMEGRGEKIEKRLKKNFKGSLGKKVHQEKSSCPPLFVPNFLEFSFSIRGQIRAYLF